MVVALVGMVLPVACADRPTSLDGDDSDATGGTATTSSISTTTALPDDTGSSNPTADTTGTDSDTVDDGPPCVAEGDGLDDEHSWRCVPDGPGPVWECDVLAQDCRPGEKCMPWSNDGGDVWNATQCSPVVAEADQLGDPCTVEGSPLSGADSCAQGLMCWNVDIGTLQGECVAMCTGTDDAPTCAPAGTQCAAFNEQAIRLCLPSCDPLAPDCGDLAVCSPDQADRWSCVPTYREPTQVGEVCGLANHCALGSVCADRTVYPGCSGMGYGCCTHLCDLTVGTCPVAGTECIPWHEPGLAPPGQQNVGICSDERAPPRGIWVYNHWINFT